MNEQEQEVVDAAKQWKRTITGSVIGGLELSRAQLRLIDAVEALELSE